MMMMMMMMMPKMRLMLLYALVSLAPAIAQEDAVCYEDLPCFPMNSPWSSEQRPIPAPRSPQQVATTFTLFTRVTQWVGYNVTTWPHVSLEGSDYEGSRSTVWIIQGASMDWNQSWMHDMKNTFLDKEDSNVVLVVWGKGDPNYNFTYYQAVADTRLAGAEMARVGKYMIENKGASASAFHIIGFSLGGQIAGYMGKGLPNIGFITALDPSDAGFENFPSEVRLNKHDAGLVQVLHTAIAPPVPGLGPGRSLPAGDVDFYLNGGKIQPGCNPKNYSINTSEDFDSLSEDDIDEIVGCSHTRSVDVYLEAISSTNCTFWGLKRNSSTQRACTRSTCRPIGRSDHRFHAVGILDVVTSDSSPYCIGGGRNAHVKQRREACS